GPGAVLGGRCHRLQQSARAHPVRSRPPRRDQGIHGARPAGGPGRLARARDDARGRPAPLVRAGDILDALELLGVTALLHQAQSEGVLEQVETELFDVSRLIDGSGELTAALDGERDDPARRATLLGRLLDGRTHRLTAALAARAVGRRTETKPARRVEEFARFASDRRRRAFAAVSSAVPL